MQGHSTAGHRAPSSANGCTRALKAPKPAPSGVLPRRGQAIRARGVAPASADAAGRPWSIGSAIAFHPEGKRRRDASPQTPTPRRFPQTFLVACRKARPPDLEEKIKGAGGIKQRTIRRRTYACSCTSWGLRGSQAGLLPARR
eukprot:scaffold6949_cov61-Phaeocystis_antarctica.AAC.2